MDTSPVTIESVRYPGEKGAFVALAIASSITLVALIVSMVGLLYLAIFLLAALMGKALALAAIRGQGIRVTGDQYPQICEYVHNFAARLQLKYEPEVYVVQATFMNAFATKLIRRRYVVLYSHLVDAALESGDTGEVAMIIGHEMAHHAAGHIRWSGFLQLGFWIPFLYLYWSRRAEYTCDRAGLLLVNKLTPSVQGIVKLAVGRKLAASTNLGAVRRQKEQVANEFGPKLVEIFSTHPLTIKRIIEIEDFAKVRQVA